MNLSKNSTKFKSTLPIVLAAVKKYPFLRVFPVEADNKAQPLLKDYLRKASNDPATIKQWHAYWKKQLDGCEPWWGIAPELSGLVFVDVDVKSGKKGQETYDLFEMLYGWPPTLTSGSPSGGFHKWYRGKHLFALGRDGSNHPGIDFAQYVLLPGCEKSDGTAYTWRDKLPIADAPAWIYDETRKPDRENASSKDALIELDKPENVATAEDYLSNDAPKAIEGDHGEFTTLKVAAALRDLGISESRAVELMADIYNTDEHCEPTWDYDDLCQKIANAFKYCTLNRPGSVTAEAEFFPDGLPDVTAEDKAARLAKTEERRERRNAVAKPETFESLKQNYSYIGQQKRFVRDSDAMLWDGEAFDKFFANVFAPDKSTATPIGKYLLGLKGSAGIRRFETFTYHPGKPRNCNGKFNLYVPSDIVADEGDTTLWDAHLEYLFPDPIDRGHVLNWLAWFLQNLDKKPKHALLIQGERQGTGKSFIADVMCELVGKSNCTPVDQDTFELSHNGWAMHTKLITCEEIRGLGNYTSKASKSLHGMITQERIKIDEKNMPPFTLEPFLAGLFLMTNSDKAIRPDDTDRRYLIISTPVKPQPDAYYFPLFDILDNPAALGAIKWQLENRKLDGYSGSARAPATVAKQAMAAEASSDLEKWMVDHAENPPLCYQLLNVDEVVAALPGDLQRSGQRGTNAGLRSAISDIIRRRFNGEKIKSAIRPNGRSSVGVRVWAAGPDAKDVAAKSDLVAIWNAERALFGAEALKSVEDDFGLGNPWD